MSAEADRYREALEQIAERSYSPDLRCGSKYLCAACIARAALAPTPREE